LFKLTASKLNSIVTKRPLVSAIIIGTANAGIADIFTQTVLENKSISNLNYRSFNALVLLGATAVCIDYWLVNRFYWYLFPKNTFLHTMYKVAIDQFIILPFMYFPLFYVIRETAYTIDVVPQYDTKILLEYGKQSLLKFKHNMKHDLMASWMLWVPGQFITLGILSKPWRVPFMQFLSFVWFMGLSFYRLDHTVVEVDNHDSNDNNNNNNNNNRNNNNTDNSKD